VTDIALHDSKDGTGAGLLEFLEWAGTRGELVPATARAITASTRKVLEVEADPDAVRILEVDPADLFNRFETLNRTKYTSESLSSYRSRFFNAVAMYQAWLDRRPDWRAAGGWGRRSAKGSGKPARENGEVIRRSTNRSTRKRTATANPPSAFERLAAEDRPMIAQVQVDTPMVPYDLPLRPGLRVRLVLPEVLTRADADRIAAFVGSLAFDQAEDVQGGD
jgi:hypothetical protein